MEGLSSSAQIHEYSLDLGINPPSLMRYILFLSFSLFFLASFAQDDYTVSDKKAIKCYEVSLQSFNFKDYDASLSKLEEAISREPQFIEAYLLRFEVRNSTSSVLSASSGPT